METFFEENAPSLATSFEAVERKLLSLIDDMAQDAPQSSMPPELLLTITTINRLIDGRSRSRGLEMIEGFFESWKRKKETRAREEFEEMCGESAFIDFWCRMKNTAKETGVGKKTIGEDGQEDEEEDEMVDLKEMAKSIDLGEVEAVMKKDKRWSVWDHVPERRESWIRVRICQPIPNGVFVNVPSMLTLLFIDINIGTP